MKRAYIVSFDICTRVFVDVPEDFDPDFDELPDDTIEAAVAQARANILEEPKSRICGDNVTSIEPDWELPYGSLDGEDEE